MANTTSAKKRIRQNISRTLINRSRRTRIRTYLKKVDVAIAGGDKKEATEALRVAQPEFMRGVTKGIFKKNAVARKISRLSAKIKAL